MTQCTNANTNKRKADEPCEPDQERVKRTKADAPVKKITVAEKPKGGILDNLMSLASKKSANKRKPQDDDGPARKRPLTEEPRQAFKSSVGFNGDPRATRPFHNPVGDNPPVITTDQSKSKADVGTAAAAPVAAAPEQVKSPSARAAKTKQAKDAAATTTASTAEAGLAGKKGVAHSTGNKKRKLDDSPGLPANKKQRYCNPSIQKKTTEASSSKKQKHKAADQQSIPPTMINRRYFCFINSALHLLGSVPELAAIELQGQADELLDKSPFIKENLIEATRRSREADGKRTRIREYLQNCGDELRSAFMFELIWMLKATTSGSVEQVDPAVFTNFCGALLNSASGAYFDGHSQEDVGEFIRAVINEVQISGELPLIQKLFGVEFEQIMTCDGCGEEKTFRVDDDDAFRLGVPEAVQLSGVAIDLNTLVEHFVSDTARFDQYECEACREVKKVGRMVAREGQGVKLVTKAPEYLLAPITRAGQVTGEITSKNVKLDTEVVPSAKPIKLRTSTGGHVEYELQGFAEHHGDR